MSGGGHKQLKCKDPDCGGMCNVCFLTICAVCGGAEGSLPTECPGVKMTTQEAYMVLEGVIDYYDGAWRWKTGAK